MAHVAPLQRTSGFAKASLLRDVPLSQLCSRTRCESRGTESQNLPDWKRQWSGRINAFKLHSYVYKGPFQLAVTATLRYKPTDCEMLPMWSGHSL